MSSEKEILLKPSHKSMFWWYLLGVLLIPVIGLGLIIIYRTFTALKAVEYTITDRSIRIKDSKYSEKIDLQNITRVEFNQRWIDRMFGIGDLTLFTENRSVKMLGQENPGHLADMISHAAEAERQRIFALRKKPKPEPAPDPGTLDKLDYLTGLWQQGLLSEEDYQKERKHFE
ncbi:MAG: PH domain-containing protein [Balneolaceae bacterium]|nr:MAG: PH domain-containing protein [Balneolaceae bacterium]